MSNTESQKTTCHFTDLNEQLDLEQIAPDGRIGLVALSTDLCLEQDIRRILPDSIEAFTNRVHNVNPMTHHNLGLMVDDIERAAADILPGIGVDVVVYGCTSGTAVIGFDKISELLRKSHPDAGVTTPLTAAMAALQACNAKRISVLTPYNREINEGVVETIEQQGISVINLAGLGFVNDLDVTAIAPADIVRLGSTHCDPDADALFISCTAFRATLAIDALEQRLGKPVVTSNQALAWHCMELLGYRQPVDGFGQLLSQRP